MGFFDGRVLAAPFLSRRQRCLDVFTYDTNGIEYLKCDGPCAASDFWRSKKLLFMKELEDTIRVMLLMNLSIREIASMASSKTLTVHAALQQSTKLTIDRILDKIEDVM